MSDAPRQLLAGLALGAGAITATVGILAATSTYHVNETNALTVLGPAVATAVLAGVFEELLVRSMMFRALQNAQGTWAPSLSVRCFSVYCT